MMRGHTPRSLLRAAGGARLSRALKLLTLSLSLSPLNAGASPELDRAKALYQSLHFQAAMEELLRLKQRPELTRSERIELLELLARSFIAERRQRDAVEAFAELLALEPGFALDPADAPRVVEALEAARELSRPETSAAPAPAPPPPPSTEPSVPRPAWPVAQAGAFAITDLPGGSIGAGLEGGARWRHFEALLRVLFGREVGLCIQTSYLPLGGGPVTPSLGLRASLFPGPGAGGGGPVIGARLSLGRSVSAKLDVAGEYYRVPAGYRAFAMTVSLGLDFAWMRSH